MGIYAKLSEIQDRLFVPKDQKNDFGKYNYRSCEDILKAVKPICKEIGCVLTITNELVNIGDRNYVEATVRLIDLEDATEVISKAHAREEETKKGMDGSQITGASSSYARKYALAGLFCIDNEKDSDATNKGDSETKKKQEYDPMSAFPPREDMIALVKKKYPENSDNLKSLLDLWKVKSIEDATNAQLMAIWSKYGNSRQN